MAATRDEATIQDDIRRGLHRYPSPGPSKQQWQQTEAYKAMRRRLLTRQGHCCADCGEQTHLELHHEVYPWHKWMYKDPGQWGHEENHECVMLCRDCHHQRHRDPNGEFWDDPVELHTYWESFYDALHKD
jgi:5-methylcytosine-specific restriction endonuclease McrA